METGVVVALIAAVVALGTSLITVYNQRALARDQRDLAESQNGWRGRDKVCCLERDVEILEVRLAGIDPDKTTPSQHLGSW